MDAGVRLRSGRPKPGSAPRLGWLGEREMKFEQSLVFFWAAFWCMLSRVVGGREEEGSVRRG